MGRVAGGLAGVPGSGWGSVVGRVVGAAGAAADLVLPSRCASCDGPGGPLCAACSAGARTASGAVGAHPVQLSPSPPGMPACWSAAPFEGVLREAITAYKDEDRRDLRPLLAEGLAVSVATAMGADARLRRHVAHGGVVLVVPLPSSGAARRRRGDDPVGDLARAAVSRLGGWSGRAGGLVLAPALRPVRTVADQSRLDRAQRAANLSGALAVGRRWAEVVPGGVCVVVDDVVTTGATLAEASRALRTGGASHVVAATVAATGRRAPPPALVGGGDAD